MRCRKKSGFTLVEILIVVVIMAILAATIIPQFNSSTADAKTSTAVFNLQALRSQVELFKAHHNGNAPAVLGDLTLKTNVLGTTATLGTSDTSYKFGPYMMVLPDNPFKDTNTVKTTTGTATPAVSGTEAWVYNAATGQVWINETALVNE